MSLTLSKRQALSIVCTITIKCNNRDQITQNAYHILHKQALPDPESSKHWQKWPLDTELVIVPEHEGWTLTLQIKYKYKNWKFFCDT